MHCPNGDSTQLVDRLLLEQLSLALSLSFSKRIEDHIGDDLVLCSSPQSFNDSDDIIITSKGQYPRAGSTFFA
jgi:hypothetical protein